MEFFAIVLTANKLYGNLKLVLSKTQVNRLSSIYVDTNNLTYSSIDGILYTKRQDTILFCPRAKTGTVIIPNTVIRIKDEAFSSCYGLTSVMIGKSVQEIGVFAFYDCKNLDTIISKATEPPNIDTYSTFNLVPKDVLIIIPCTGSLETYKMTWGFTNYIAENETPNIPDNLNITDIGNGLEITWQGEAKYYKVTRNWILIDTIHVTSYVDTNLVSGYLCYRIVSVNENCESEYSESVCMQYTDIVEQQIGKFQIFPNPALSQFTVTSTEDAEISLYNILGQKIKQVAATEENTIIQTEDLSAGMYVVKVKKGNGVFTKKIQIVK